MKKQDSNKYIGSDFEHYLKERGRLESSQLSAIKRIIAHELREEMKKKKITSSEMAKQLGTSRAGLMRLFDPKNTALSVNKLNRIAHVIGKDLIIKFH